MATIQQQGTIGGLSIQKFVGRQIKVTWGDKMQHPTPAKCIGFDGEHVVVAVNNGGCGIRSHKVAYHQCKPWWSKNPDLKAEAEALGAFYAGEVSVGRAFEAATHTAVKSYETPQPTEPEITLVESLPPPPRFEVTEAPPTSVKEPTPPMEQPELPLEQPAYQPLRTLVKLEITAAGDCNWAADMQEFYRVYKALKSNSDELVSLRQKIEELQRELELKQTAEDKSREDNQVMMELLVEQLTGKGVVFQWEDKGEPSTIAPAKIEKPIKTKEPVKYSPTKKSLLQDSRDFNTHIKSWLGVQTIPFTFEFVFRSLGCVDTRARREAIRRHCLSLGIKYEQHRGPGAKTVFIP